MEPIVKPEFATPITPEDRDRFIRSKERGLVEAAISYATRGWAVFPCHSIRPDAGPGACFCTCGAADCDSPGKHPRTPNGLSDATTDEATIRSWWHRWPIANVAIRTDGWIVLDCDRKPGLDGSETLALLEEEHGRLPATAEAITGGGGRHVLLLDPTGKTRNSTARLGPGLDVRATGGYIIAPPSTHPSAMRYQWEASSHPDDVEIATAPDWLVTLCLNGASGAEAKPDRWSLNRPPKGERHSKLRDLCYRWAHWLSEGEVRSLTYIVADKWGLLAENRGGEVENLVVGAFLKLRQEGKIQDVEQEPATILPALDFTTEPAPVPEPLVGDDEAQILMPDEITVIASDPGVGKTKTLTGIALAVASGKLFLGLPTIQGPVLYVTSDGDPEMHRNVVRQWEALGESRESLAALPLHVHADPEFCLEHGQSLERVEMTLSKWGVTPRLLILESLSTNVETTDVNDQIAIRQFARRYLRSLLANHPGMAIAFSAHLKKNQPGIKSDLGTRVAGSVQIRGAVDCVIALVALPGNAFTMRRVKRSRSGADFAAFNVRIDGARTEPLALVHDGLADVGEDELQGASLAVMTYLRAARGPRPLKAICTALSEWKPKAFRKRAVEKACRKLAEVSDLLVRIGTKPAIYTLKPETLGPADLEIEGIE